MADVPMMFWLNEEMFNIIRTIYILVLLDVWCINLIHLHYAPRVFCPPFNMLKLFHGVEPCDIM